MRQLVSSNNVVPLYKQVANVIASRIEAQEWKPSERLPSEPALMQEFEVSRVTVRSAISELVDNGVLVRSRGRGTFVAPVKNALTASGAIGFTRSCEMAGRRATNRILTAELVYPSIRDIGFFHLEATDKVVCVKRLRFVDDVPTVIETITLAPSLRDILMEDLTGSLTEALAVLRGSDWNGQSERTVEACLPEENEVELLGVEPGTPLLLIRDTQYGVEEDPIFLSKQVFCTAQLKLYL